MAPRNERAAPLATEPVVSAPGSDNSTTSTLADALDPQFIGYYIGPEGVERLTVAPSSIWQTSGSYAGPCCVQDETKCAYTTACSGDSAYVNDGYSYLCPTGSYCMTMTIFSSFPTGLPTQINYGCRQSWSANSVYRVLPISSTAGTSCSPPPTWVYSPATAVPTLAVSSVPTDTAPSAPSTSLGTGTPPWILAPVLGSVVVVVLIVVALFLMAKQRKKRGAVFTLPMGGPRMTMKLKREERSARHRSTDPHRRPQAQPRVGQRVRR
ncbi:hypothetical protein GQ53DRAFT_838751 [Thozetella sp. PMI_491]|nr:hypothetical protein GQ53DRAFT_838751 [Thozetella sp. PMI_491]